MIFLPRISLDKKSRIICVKLERGKSIFFMETHGKLFVAYDSDHEIARLYLLPFSSDEFVPLEELRSGVFAPSSLLGA